MAGDGAFRRPTDVRSACQTLSKADDSVVVAGGQSLSLAVNDGAVDPEVFVDISRIDSLEGIAAEETRFRLGALTTYSDVETSAVVRRRAAVLADAIARIGDQQIRNAGTVGGAIALADPSADVPPVLVSLGAVFETRTTEQSRTYDAEEFFTESGKSVLDGDELVTEVRVPNVGADSGAGFEKFASRTNGRAIVNVAARVRVEDGQCANARVCIGGVRDRIVVSDEAESELLGTGLSDERLERAGAAASDGIQVRTDSPATRAHREGLVEVLTEDALQIARERARDGVSSREGGNSCSS